MDEKRRTADRYGKGAAQKAGYHRLTVTPYPLRWIRPCAINAQKNSIRKVWMMMKDLLLVIAKALVDHPDDVTVTEVEKEDGEITLELRVHEDDMGKVIGKQGRIAKAMRTVMKSAANRENKKVSVDIV